MMFQNIKESSSEEKRVNRLQEQTRIHMQNFRVDQALEIIWGAISGLDKYLQKERPWERGIREQEELLSSVVLGKENLISIREIADALEPFMPTTAREIKKRFQAEKIAKGESLFPRII